MNSPIKSSPSTPFHSCPRPLPFPIQNDSILPPPVPYHAPPDSDTALSKPNPVTPILLPVVQVTTGQARGHRSNHCHHPMLISHSLFQNLPHRIHISQFLLPWLSWLIALPPVRGLIELAIVVIGIGIFLVLAIFPVVALSREVFATPLVSIQFLDVMATSSPIEHGAYSGFLEESLKLVVRQSCWLERRRLPLCARRSPPPSSNRPR